MDQLIGNFFIYLGVSAKSGPGFTLQSLHQKNDAKEEEGVLLNLIPKFSLDDFNDEIVETIKIYLSNRTRVGYRFVYEQAFLGTVDFSIESTIPPFTDFYIHDFPFSAVNDNLSFAIDFSLIEPHKKKAAHFETQLKIKPIVSKSGNIKGRKQNHY